MKTYTFKDLNYKPEGNRIQRALKSPHVRKTIITALIGGLIAYVLFMLSEGRHTGVFWTNDAFKQVLMGIGIGVFITNSPCARGKC